MMRELKQIFLQVKIMKNFISLTSLNRTTSAALCAWALLHSYLTDYDKGARF